MYFTFLAFLLPKIHSCRLVWSRTPLFHGGNMGSNPIRSTKSTSLVLTDWAFLMAQI